MKFKFLTYTSTHVSSTKSKSTSVFGEYRSPYQPNSKSSTLPRLSWQDASFHTPDVLRIPVHDLQRKPESSNINAIMVVLDTSVQGYRRTVDYSIQASQFKGKNFTLVSITKGACSFQGWRGRGNYCWMSNSGKKNNQKQANFIVMRTDQKSG